MALDVLSWLLVTLIALRVYSLMAACAWIYENGESFDAGFRHLSPKDKLDPEKIWDLYGRTNGQFWPFGVKSWRLKIAGHRASGWRAAGLRLVRLAWLYWLLGPFFVIALLVLTFSSEGSGDGRVPQVLAALLLLAGAISLAAEGAIARGSGLSWSGTYHRWPRITNKMHPEHPNQDLALVAGTALLVAIPSMTTLLVVAGRRLAAFADYPTKASIGEQVFRSLEACFAAVGGTGFEAANAWGHVVKTLVALTFIAYAVVLVGRIVGFSVSPARRGLGR